MHDRPPILDAQLGRKFWRLVPPIEYQQRLQQESLFPLRRVTSLHALVVQAYADESIWHKIEFGDFGKPEPEVPVLAERQLFIKPPGPLQQLAAHDHGRTGPGNDVSLGQQIVKQIVPSSRLDNTATFKTSSALVDMIIGTVNKTDPRWGG